jgi:hypothetical protein
VVTDDQRFAHARYLYRIRGEDLYGELFAQYREDFFKGIDNRVLVGGDLRLRLAKAERWGRLYGALGVFHEEIDYTIYVPDEDESADRLNTNLSYTHTPAERTEFSLLGYYQPSFEDVDDYYASFVGELQVQVVGELYLTLGYAWEYDSRPPAGVFKEDTTTKTSLAWKF